MHVRDTQGLLDGGSWWRGGSGDKAQAGQLDTGGGLPDALVEGMEWPSGSNRSVVVVALRDPAGIPDFLTAFLKTSQSSEIAQSVSVLHGAQFSSYRIGSDAYRVGDISWPARVTTTFQAYPWLIAVVTVMFCFLIAVLVQAELRRRARLRLASEEY